MITATMSFGVLVGLMLPIIQFFSVDGFQATIIPSHTGINSLSRRRPMLSHTGSSSTGSNNYAAAAPSSFVLFMSSNENTPNGDVSLSSSTDEETNKPPVKCPDCDLCDGSGRYEQKNGRTNDYLAGLTTQL
jgi:hypothetical protein